VEHHPIAETWDNVARRQNVHEHRLRFVQASHRFGIGSVDPPAPVGDRD
jgi:hypothetical protein